MCGILWQWPWYRRCHSPQAKYRSTCSGIRIDHRSFCALSTNYICSPRSLLHYCRDKPSYQTIHRELDVQCRIRSRSSTWNCPRLLKTAYLRTFRYSGVIGRLAWSRRVSFLFSLWPNREILPSFIHKPLRYQSFIIIGRWTGSN